MEVSLETSPFDDLPTLDGLKPLFEDTSTEARNAQTSLPANLRHARRSTKRQQLHLLEVTNAAKHLQQLPAEGESLHCVMKGNFHAWDMVPAVAQLGGTIKRLNVATLGFNKQNATELVEMLDQGKVEAVSFICSCYFKSTGGDAFEFLHTQLSQRGHRMVAIRCHAKILLMEMTDGNHYVVESSANLRSCRNIEQFCLTNDRDLLHFHRDWMETVIDDALRTPSR